MLVGRGDEKATLVRLIEGARDGVSGALVLEGAPGVGKTALLEFAATTGAGMQITRAVGVQPEMELPFAGLHQLLLPFLDGLDNLPVPQRDALRSAFGLSTTPGRDRFLVGLAALTLISDAAAQKPVLCLVDDVQWLDPASIDALGFAARRMLADRVAMIFAIRHQAEQRDVLRGLACLGFSGLEHEAALELLAQAVRTAVDESVAKRVVAEVAGHPLAIVELAAELSPDELAGRVPLRDPLPLGPRLEGLYHARARALPGAVRTLLLLAAADPSGDAELVSRAANHLGLDLTATDPPPDVEPFLTFTPHVRFRHPLMRSAAYYGRSASERRRAHEALAAASDPEQQPDHRAWHRAAAAAGPDAEIATELERVAARAQRRGGWAGAARFLERAVELTPDEPGRAKRTLASARARLLAGDTAAGQRQLDLAWPHLEDMGDRAEATRLEGTIRFTSGQVSAAAAAFLEAATMLRPRDVRGARDTLLQAFEAALGSGFSNGTSPTHVLRTALATPIDRSQATPADDLLDGFAAVAKLGHAAGVPLLRRGIERIISEDPAEAFRWLPLAWHAAHEIFDDGAWQTVTERWAQKARRQGAVAALPIGLGRLPYFYVVVGRFPVAERAFAEAEEIATAIGVATRFGAHSSTEVAALAWRGQAEETRTAATALLERFTALGRGGASRAVYHSIAVLELGRGNYPAALTSAQRAQPGDQFSHLSLAPELIEAAVRSGQAELAAQPLQDLSIRAHACGTNWALGLLLRSQALLAPDEEAEELYRAGIDHLGRSLVVPQTGRAHLLYGEWLRRKRRRRDAREQLRTAFEILGEIGAEAFAERARVELVATGEHVRRRSIETVDELTPKEGQIARLASEGASNREIATQLFISTPTVVYHLQKVFRKLDVTNRASLARALGERSPG
jgi:DNA-binding CsgD family transcriptional regulator